MLLPTEFTMTLKEWSEQTGIKIITYESGCMCVANRFPVREGWELFHLTDYCVSSNVAGTIWLIKRN